MTVDELKRLFGFEEDQELAAVLGKTKAAVSIWRNNGEIPAAAEKKARGLLGSKNVDLSGYATSTKKQRPIELLIEKKLEEKTDQELEEIYYQLLTFERAKGGNASGG